MMETVKLAAEHIAQMAEIEKQCFKTPWSHDTLEKELYNPLANYFVVNEGETVVAYIGYYKIFDEAHITNVAVAPPYQGRRIATELIEYTLDKMREQGIARATLEVNANNEKAIRLYEKFGFRLSGRRPKYYEGTDDALIYWLEL